MMNFIIFDEACEVNPNVRVELVFEPEATLAIVIVDAGGPSSRAPQSSPMVFQDPISPHAP